MKGPTSKYYVEEWYDAIEKNFEKAKVMDCTETPWHNFLINVCYDAAEKIPLVRLIPAGFKQWSMRTWVRTPNIL